MNISSYQRRRKRSSSCRTFLHSSITHQCLLLNPMEDQQQGNITKQLLQLYFGEKRSLETSLVALQSYLSSGGLISAVQRQSGPGPNSTGQGPRRGGRRGRGGKKGQQSSMQRQVDPEEPSLDGLFAWRASA